MDELETIVEDVLSSPKYHAIHRDLVRTIAEVESRKRKSNKEIVKATKNKLHQICGAYLQVKPAYETWRHKLKQANTDIELRKKLCIDIMRAHSSTQERLQILEEFYSGIFAHLPPVASIVDLACGFNPLAIPWMGLPKGVSYFAYDVYDDLADFNTFVIRYFGVEGAGYSCDVLRSCPIQPANVAFLLKALSCLEQLDPQATPELLGRIPCPYVVVSFPVRSLSGKSKGMASFYEERFMKAVALYPWSVQKLEFLSELVFIVNKNST